MKSQQGFTLPELLIASFLGLILLLAIGQVLLTGNETFRLQRSLSRINDGGRYGAWFLSDQIQRAGWSGDDFVVPFNHAIAFNQDEDAWCEENVCTQDGGDDNSDAIAVRYSASVDCTGNSVSSIAVNKIYSDGDSLLCIGNGGDTPTLITKGVDSLQILYGIDYDADGTVDYYADARLAEDNQGKIKSVRFSLLMKSERGGEIAVEPRSYQVEDRIIVKNDDIPRRIFSKTVPIRNWVEIKI